MSATKISELTAVTSISANDLFVVVRDPTGSPSTKKIAASDMLANVVVTAKFANTFTVTGSFVSTSNLTANNLYVTNRSTPANSTASVAGGKMWFDSNYIYVSTANNVIKRVQLQSF